MTNPAPQRPTIGLAAAAAAVVASMIGAGVFTTSGFTLAALGKPSLVLLTWGLGGLLALCGAIAYGALAAELTENGGEYLFLSRRWHPIVGMAAGLVSMLAGFTGAIALVARVSAEHLVGLLTATWTIDVGGLAAAIVLLAAAAHLVGLKPGARVQTATVALLLLALVAVTVVLFLAPVAAVAPAHATTSDTAAASPTAGLVRELAISLVWVSLSYCGFNAAVYITRDVREPESTIPRALIWGTLLTTGLYLLFNAAMLRAGPTIAGRPDVAVAAMTVARPAVVPWLQATIALATFTSVSVGVMTGPRVYAQMAADGLLPSFFAVSAEAPDDVPRRAIVAQTLAAMAAAAVATITTFLDTLGLTLSISAAAAVAMVFRLKSPARPLQRVAAGVFVVATLGLAAVMAVSVPRRAIAAALTLAVSLAVSVAVHRRRRSLGDVRREGASRSEADAAAEAPHSLR